MHVECILKACYMPIEGMLYGLYMHVCILHGLYMHVFSLSFTNQHHTPARLQYFPIVTSSSCSFFSSSLSYPLFPSASL